jgi:predicted alpha/beta-fold hydrolase
MQAPDFAPPRWLVNGHVQTILGSVARRSLPVRESAYVDTASTEDIQTPDGTTLRVRLNLKDRAAPLVVLIHGWLGCDASAYVLSTGAALFRAGYSTARMNLRDHGDTAHLNLELYHSARTREVVDLVKALAGRSGTRGAAVIGFSLGGNFALRVARESGLPALAVCPAIDPAETMRRIDHGSGSVIYRRYFMRKWQASLEAKAEAFPGHYDFSGARSLRSVQAMTDYFVREYSGFRNTRAYFDAYDLTGNALQGVEATVLIAADDPIIGVHDFRVLPRGIEVVEKHTGGHNAFIKDRRFASWTDDYAVAWCQPRLPV